MQRFSPISIRVIYSDSTCIPVLLNPDAIKYHSVFSFEKIAISDSSITWNSKGEHENARYEIERFNLGYWEPMETISSKGVYGGSRYEYFPVYEEGANKFRIKYSNDGETLYSYEVEHVFYPDPISFKKEDDLLVLSRACEYVITDTDNFEVLIGAGKEIDISGIGNGEFYIVFDEEQVELFRKNDNVKVVKKPESNN